MIAGLAGKIIAVVGATEAQGSGPVHAIRALNPAMQTFDSWLAKDKQRIPVE